MSCPYVSSNASRADYSSGPVILYFFLWTGALVLQQYHVRVPCSDRATGAVVITAYGPADDLTGGRGIGRLSIGPATTQV